MAREITNQGSENFHPRTDRVHHHFLGESLRVFSLFLPVVNGHSFFRSKGHSCSSVKWLTLTEAFALVGGTIDENLGGYDVAKGDEHLHELTVTKLLRQVVDEQVAAFGSWDRASYHINQSTSKHLNLKYNTQVRMLVSWMSFVLRNIMIPTR